MWLLLHYDCRCSASRQCRIYELDFRCPRCCKFETPFLKRGFIDIGALEIFVLNFFVYEHEIGTFVQCCSTRFPVHDNGTATQRAKLSCCNHCVRIEFRFVFERTLRAIRHTVFAPRSQGHKPFPTRVLQQKILDTARKTLTSARQVLSSKLKMVVADCVLI